MSNPKKNIASYSASDIQQYLKGTLSPAEMHELEKTALKDPFLSDAMEGYEKTGLSFVAHDLDLIHKQLSVKPHVPAKIIQATTKMVAWKAAVAIGLITGVTTVSVYLAKDKTPHPTNSQTAVVVPQKKSTDTLNETVVVENTNTTIVKEIPAPHVSIAEKKMIPASPVTQNNSNTIPVASNAVFSSPTVVGNLYTPGTITGGTLNSSEISGNITTLGNVKAITVSGNYVPGTITGGTFSGTLNPSSTSGNITTLGTVKAITVSGINFPGTITGGTFSGTLSRLSTSGYVTTDPNTIVVLGTDHPYEVSHTTAQTLSGNLTVVQSGTPVGLTIGKNGAVVLPPSFLLVENVIVLKDTEGRLSNFKLTGRHVKFALASQKGSGMMLDTINPVIGLSAYKNYLRDKLGLNAGSLKPESSSSLTAELAITFTGSGKVLDVKVINSFAPSLNTKLIKAIEEGSSWYIRIHSLQNNVRFNDSATFGLIITMPLF